MSCELETIESLFFDRYASSLDKDVVPMVFILGSPRTGSTLFYQLIINFFDFFYFSNLINNHFAEHPVVGAALQHQLEPNPDVSYKSRYGKTEGEFGPSEASYVFRNWFGGGHPSQIVSSEVLPGKDKHLCQSLQSIYALFGKPILIKNAWNCFRIEALAQRFANAYFIWIRRDITHAALSDLEARYRKGDPVATVWNSATTKNYKAIQKLPYWNQVVEQQYEYNRSIGRDLETYASERYIELWYENICARTRITLERLVEFFTVHDLVFSLKESTIPLLNRSSGPKGLEKDAQKIQAYIDTHSQRFADYRYS